MESIGTTLAARYGSARFMGSAMEETPRALDKLYTMLHEAEDLGLSRPARMRLVSIIGSLENEELARFQEEYFPGRGDDLASSSSRDDDRFDDRFARG